MRTPEAIAAREALRLRNRTRYRRCYARHAPPSPKVVRPERRHTLGKYKQPFDIRYLSPPREGTYFISARTGEPYGR